jgi:hypothetical protein
MNFPFGEQVKKVEQKDKSIKEYFILGVYASAVHAKWIGIDGKIKVKALAVASEPEIFWRGDYQEASEIISNIKLKKEIGKLEVADSIFNGPSGIELDKSYLEPLGLSRKDVWLCDLLPYSRLNAGQKRAIEREYAPIEIKFDLPKVTIERIPRQFSNEFRINEILNEIKSSGAKKIILLGDIPIREFLNKFDSRFRQLSEINSYGEFIQVKILGETYQILPLVHPRQAGKLGRASDKWFKLHEDWKKRISGT